MRIQHLVAAANIDAEGFVIDPFLVRHGLIVAGRIAELAGPIEPLTHLNLDFPDHRLGDCLIAEQLAVGATLLWDGDHFRVSRARPLAYQRLGAVNIAQRRVAWQQRLGRPHE
ncbi:MAG: hypothetical protein MI924_38915 [Chloroflexales bacterium]|nr:hypothetical protein [Chloroflexales bacterium]